MSESNVGAEHREVVVIGGGQAGLAIGYFLAQHGRDFTILEAAEYVAHEIEQVRSTEGVT